MTKKIGTVEKLLKAARRKIEKPERWCKNDYAIDVNGRGVFSWGEYACKFCITGALSSITGMAHHNRRQDARQILNSVACLVPYHKDGSSIDEILAVTLNDYGDFGHKGVLLCYDLAIATAHGADI